MCIFKVRNVENKINECVSLRLDFILKNTDKQIDTCRQPTHTILSICMFVFMEE